MKLSNVAMKPCPFPLITTDGVVQQTEQVLGIGVDQPVQRGKLRYFAVRKRVKVLKLFKDSFFKKPKKKAQAFRLSLIFFLEKSLDS